MTKTKETLPEKSASEKPITASLFSCSLDKNFEIKLLRHTLEAIQIKNSDTEDVNSQIRAVIVAMKGVKPKDEIEGMLAAQMTATHFAAMRMMQQLKNSNIITQQDSNGNLAIKLLRTYTAQMEALQRYRGKGQQKMTVEHVHVYSGGQAIVGQVSNPKGGGVITKTVEQPHAK